MGGRKKLFLFGDMAPNLSPPPSAFLGDKNSKKKLTLFLNFFHVYYSQSERGSTPSRLRDMFPKKNIFNALPLLMLFILQPYLQSFVIVTQKSFQVKI